MIPGTSRNLAIGAALLAGATALGVTVARNADEPAAQPAPATVVEAVEPLEPAAPAPPIPDAVAETEPDANALARLDAERLRLADALTAAEAEALRLANLLAARDAEAAAAPPDPALADQASEIARLETELAARDADLARLEAALEQKSDQIAGLRADLAARDDDIDRLLAEKAEATAAATPAAATPPDSAADVAIGTVKEPTGTPAAPPAAPDKPSPLVEVHFDMGSAHLTPGGQARARDAAAELAATPFDKIRITGHSDTIGAAKANLALSRARAQVVADALIAAGVPPERIEVVGLGQEADTLPVPTPAGVAEPLNRCAGVWVLPAV